jgi:hypothetical protein
MTRTELKQGRAGGRTPFEVLDDFPWTGDSDDLIMWREYADEEIGGEDLAVIHSDDWRRITQIPISPALPNSRMRCERIIIRFAPRHLRPERPHDNVPASS